MVIPKFQMWALLRFAPTDIPLGVKSVKILFPIFGCIASPLVGRFHLCWCHCVHSQPVVGHRGDRMECEINALAAAQSIIVTIATVG